MDAVQQRKNFEHMFRIFDTNRNGFLTFDDYSVKADAICNEWGFSKGGQEYQGVIDMVRLDWEKLARSADKNADDRVSPKEFIDYYVAEVATEEGFRTQVYEMTESLIGMVDRDGDGRVNAEEYARLEQLCGVNDPAAIAVSFAAIDMDRDGFVTLDEIQRAAAQFHRPNGPDDPGNLFFGPMS